MKSRFLLGILAAILGVSSFIAQSSSDFIAQSNPRSKSTNRNHVNLNVFINGTNKEYLWISTNNERWYSTDGIKFNKLDKTNNITSTIAYLANGIAFESSANTTHELVMIGNVRSKDNKYLLATNIGGKYYFSDDDEKYVLLKTSGEMDNKSTLSKTVGSIFKNFGRGKDPMHYNIENGTDYQSGSYNAPGIFMNSAKVSDSTYFMYISSNRGYYLSRDKGVTFKKVNKNNGEPIKDNSGKEVGCDIPYLGLENGGFFEHKSDKSSPRVAVYQNTPNMNNANMNGKKYCISKNKSIPGDWISDDGIEFNGIGDKDKKKLYFLKNYVVCEDEMLFNPDSNTKAKFSDIKSKYSKILKCDFYLGKNLNDGSFLTICIFGKDSKINKRYFISATNDFMEYSLIDSASGNTQYFAGFNLDSDLLKKCINNIANDAEYKKIYIKYFDGTYSNAIFMDSDTVQNSTKILYISASGGWYLSKDKGVTFNKMANDKYGNMEMHDQKTGTKIGCDIAYLGLKNGGFFEYKSNNPKHKDSKFEILMNTDYSYENTKYYLPTNSEKNKDAFPPDVDWISKYGILFSNSKEPDVYFPLDPLDENITEDSPPKNRYVDKFDIDNYNTTLSLQNNLLRIQTKTDSDFSVNLSGYSPKLELINVTLKTEDKRSIDVPHLNLTYNNKEVKFDLLNALEVFGQIRVIKFDNKNFLITKFGIISTDKTALMTIENNTIKILDNKTFDFDSKIDISQLKSGQNIIFFKCMGEGTIKGLTLKKSPQSKDDRFDFTMENIPITDEKGKIISSYPNLSVSVPFEFFTNIANAVNDRAIFNISCIHPFIEINGIKLYLKIETLRFERKVYFQLNISTECPVINIY